MAAGATPEERQAMSEAPLSEHRAAFGLEPPTLPPTMLETYEADFAPWESDFLVAARQHGLAADVVRGLRDDGIRLGMSVDGRPLDEATLDRTLAKYGDKLTDDQKKHLKAYWRRIEGGGAA